MILWFWVLRFCDYVILDLFMVARFYFYGGGWIFFRIVMARFVHGGWIVV